MGHYKLAKTSYLMESKTYWKKPDVLEVVSLSSMFIVIMDRPRRHYGIATSFNKHPG